MIERIVHVLARLAEGAGFFLAGVAAFLFLLIMVETVVREVLGQRQ